jgi:uncharacterized membrane protein (DUF4010 family)
VNAEVISALSLAIGLGLLIGLQRQHAGSEFGGIRTFPLISLLGAVCGLLAPGWGGIVVAGGLVAIAMTTLVSNLRRPNSDTEGAGQTTEAAALLTFATGSLLTTEYQPYAIAVAGLTAVLLHAKTLLHRFAGKLTERDLQAIMRFAVVSLIVLPLVPDTEFGPYRVLNPRNIWWMVVLIVGIGLAGYVSIRIFGERAGGWLSGILGGLVSSTATTVAYARRVRENADAATLAAFVIVVASTVAAARVIVEVVIIAPSVARVIAVPLGIFLALMILISLAVARRSKSDNNEMPEPGNPAELTSALVFAAIYAVITLASVAAKDYFGASALYGVALISGFVDVDAITLSTARQATEGGIGTPTAWRVILVASLINLLFKAGIAGLLGSGRLAKLLLLPIGVALSGGAALLLFWPDK